MLQSLFDKNGDGLISREEAPNRLKDAFELLDRNKDGQLDSNELANLPGR
jgi:Ca2+-binding EF-hand superfamily protein